MMPDYSRQTPVRSEIDATTGFLLLEFGSSGCGHCRAAHPLIVSALASYPDLRHIRVQDGPGHMLGRSFGVKLWPTLIVLRDGRELARVVRPAAADDITAALAVSGVA